MISESQQSSQSFIQLFKPRYTPFAGSKVLKTETEKFKAQSFFVQCMRNMQTRLLYRASLQQFSANQFHNNCDGIPNTVFLIKTERNKIIGAYTPLTSKGKQDGSLISQQDKSKESFVFSVSNMDKLAISQNSKKQIRHHKDYGTIFSGEQWNDLVIKDRANNNNGSFVCVGNGYSNPKYKRNDHASQKLFSGSSNGYFQIQQWQVYELKL